MVNCPPPATTKAYCTNTTASTVQFSVAPSRHRAVLLHSSRLLVQGFRASHRPKLAARLSARTSKENTCSQMIRDDQRSRRSARRSARFVAKGLMDSGRGTKAPAETGSDGLEEFEDRPSS